MTDITWLRRLALAAAVAAVPLATLGCEETDAEPDGDLDSTFGQTSLIDDEAAMATNEFAGEAITIRKSIPDAIKLGSPFTYTIDLTNTSGSPLANVKVMEELPEGFEFRSSEPQGEMKDGKLVFQMDDMPADATGQIKITGVAQSAGQLQICTTYDFTRGVCTPINVVNPALAIQRMAPDLANVCEFVPVQYVVKNTGDTPAEDVVLFESLADGLIAEGYDGSDLAIEIGDLDAGAERTVEIMVAAEQPLTFSSYAMAKSELDSVESSTGETTFVAPELKVTVNPTRDYQYIGKDAAFEVVVENVGEGVAFDTGIGFGVEGGELARVGAGSYAGDAQMASADMGDGSDGFEIGRLEPGDTKRFFIEVGTEAEGELKVAAAAKAVCARTDLALAEDAATASIRIAPIVALQVEVIDTVDPVQVGNETVYEIAVLNEGTGGETNVNLTATLPEGMSFVSAEGTSEVTADGTSLTFAPVADLPAGEAAVWYVTAKVDSASGQNNLQLKVNSDNLNEEITEQEPTRTY